MVLLASNKKCIKYEGLSNQIEILEISMNIL